MFTHHFSVQTWRRRFANTQNQTSIKQCRTHSKTGVLSKIAALAFISISSVANANAIDETQLLNFERCTVSVEALEVDAECATFKRHENPLDVTSKLIDLSVVKFPSYSIEPEPDAFTVIQGGPGMSSIDLAAAYGPIFDHIRKKRDILVLDQRGTGRSNMLTCDMSEIEAQPFSVTLIKQATESCGGDLSISNDLRFYTTSVAVDDLEALRQATGYSQLNIYGTSYGSRVAQHYLRQYPEYTRTVIIDGVVPIGLNLAGGEIARRWEDSFEVLNTRCRKEPACYQAHGDLYDAYNDISHTFAKQTISTSFAHPTTGEMTEYTFTNDSLFAAMRTMAYTRTSAAMMPLLLSEARKGNYQFVAAQISLMKEGFVQQMAFGMHNSVACTEDAPFVTAQDRAKADKTLIGRQMSDGLIAGCSVWPKGILDENFHQPFTSPVPVLVLSGEVDPVTPPANGEVAANMLGNSKHIVVPGHGHGVISKGCLPKLASIFITDANFDNVDDSCTQRQRPMPIFSTLTGPTS